MISSQKESRQKPLLCSVETGESKQRPSLSTSLNFDKIRVNKKHQLEEMVDQQNSLFNMSQFSRTGYGKTRAWTTIDPNQAFKVPSRQVTRKAVGTSVTFDASDNLLEASVDSIISSLPQTSHNRLRSSMHQNKSKVPFLNLSGCSRSTRAQTRLSHTRNLHS